MTCRGAHLGTSVDVSYSRMTKWRSLLSPSLWPPVNCPQYNFRRGVGWDEHPFDTDMNIPLTWISLLLLTVQEFFLGKTTSFLIATEHNLPNEAWQKKLTPNTHCADKFVPRNYTELHRITSLTAGSSNYTYRCVLSSDINRRKKKNHTIKGAMHISRRTHTHTQLAKSLPLSHTNHATLPPR